jgi:hypothetical protein
MKAIQMTDRFSTMTEAQQTFESMASMDGFLGGRVYAEYRVQVFFECDQDLPYGELYEGSPERVVQVRRGLGVGNPKTEVPPFKAVQSTQKQEQPEPELDEVDTARVKWIEASENARKSWLAKDMKTFAELAKISHQLNEIYTALLHKAVYETPITGYWN